MKETDEWLIRHYAEMPTSTLLQFALSGGSADPDEWVIANTTFKRTNDYLMAARVQMGRIWSDLEASESTMEASTVRDADGNVAYTDWDAHSQAFEWQTMAFIDIHFYFNCWDSIRKTLRLLCKRVKSLKTPHEVFDKHKATIEDYIDARHNLEHFDERLPGERGASKAVSPPDSMVSGASYRSYGNLEGGLYRFGARSWDVTPNSLARLENIVAELESGIREEAILMLVQQHRARMAD